MGIKRIDRFRGALLGVLAGDSIAARLENKTAAFIADDLSKTGGQLLMEDYIEPWKGVRHIKAGQPTDDSELTAALGLALATYPGFSPHDIYRHLRDFIHGNTPAGRKSVLTDGDAYGSGGTLRAALRPATYEESVACFSYGEIPILPSNGSLMRSVPIPLRYYGDVKLLVRYARWQSCITHMHPTAQAACIVYAVLVSFVLGRNTVPVAWQKTKKVLSEERYRNIPELADLLAMDVSRPGDNDIWPHSGSVAVSLRVALWASLTATDFRDGITKATLVGGDTDTYAAIAGGILGARFGDRGIPTEWRQVLQGRDIMITIADKLYEFAHG